MNAAVASIRDWFRDVLRAWNRFWFTPAQPHTLALIRILGGGMLLYTHLAWTLHLSNFLGPNSWVTREVSQSLHQDTWAWSYWWLVDSPALMWTLHIAAVVVFAMLMLGVYTRVVAVLAWLMAVAYCHRLIGAMFGLDTTNTMIALYLMVGPAGAVWSVDHWRARRGAERAGRKAPDVQPSVSANVAIRLLQLHLCIVYLFGGIGKMRGELWWDGSALWYALANYEYQSLPMTWLIHAPWLIALLSAVTLFWETFYCFLVWPRLTRPIALGMAVLVHGGIAAFMGMITFGLAMIFANLAFIPPEMTRSCVERLAGRRSRPHDQAQPARQKQASKKQLRASRAAWRPHAPR
ncbi:MAG: HTTM domain-containing protein [Planctomycetes bacterium]|nr:HTTM domain-containing protein [Planctomycetota bacterium]